MCEIPQDVQKTDMRYS